VSLVTSFRRAERDAAIMKTCWNSGSEMGRRWRASMLGFVAVELQSSETFLEVASKSYDRVQQIAYLELSREAYRTAVHFCGRIPMSMAEQKRFRVEMTGLRERLEWFGPIYEAAGPPENGGRETPAGGGWIQTSTPKRKKSAKQSAAKFLRWCEELRVEAHRMVARNRELMEKDLLSKEEAIVIQRVS